MTVGRHKEWDDGEYRINARFPVSVGSALKAMAERNRRSINNELIFLIEQAEKSASQPTA